MQIFHIRRWVIRMLYSVVDLGRQAVTRPFRSLNYIFCLTFGGHFTHVPLLFPLQADALAEALLK